MLFPTGAFALFFATVFALHWLLNHWPLADRLMLLGASLVFYAWFSLALCALLMGVALWAWAVGRWVAWEGAGPRPGRGPLWIGVLGVLGVLGWCKYANFLLEELAGPLALALGFLPPAVIDLVPIVGISFYCFQAISYLVDVRRGDVTAERAPLNVMLYLGFFPHLAAGPIVRAAHFLPQLREPPDRARIPMLMAGLLIVGGLAKKLLIASPLATGLVDPAFRDPWSLDAAGAALAIYGYAVQIYCDFSAYSDMAIGVAALLGYHFPRNFDQPYRAASLRDFWQRWHISLSFWFRDYVYKPLGGNRRHGSRNALVAMVLSGLWHGAAWNFLLWGALHGVGLVVERALGWARGGRWLGVFITFHLVCLGWVLFRAPDMAHAGAMLAALGRWEGVTLAWPMLALVAAGLALHALPPDWVQRLEARLAPWPSWSLGLAFGAAILLILTLGPEGVAPFIYFQF